MISFHSESSHAQALMVKVTVKAKNNCGGN